MTSGSGEGKEPLAGSPGNPSASAALNGLVVSLPHLSSDIQKVGSLLHNRDKLPYRPQLLRYEEKQRTLGGV